MTTTLEHPGATIEIDELSGGVRRVNVRSTDPRLGVPPRSAETTYPQELIERILQVKGHAYLCDELRRDEDPRYVQLSLRDSMLGYVDEAVFDGARLLDFGCGCAASTAILGRMFPKLEIVGLELVPEYVEVASERLAHHRLTNATVTTSPDACSLPPGVGQFDFVLLSAVWEHLLPHERRHLLPALWNVLRPGGILFLNQTPYRWSPRESHTTGLPLLNYLPAPIALRVARRFGKRVARDETWETLLRRGVRGGAVGELDAILRPEDHAPELLEPSRFSGRDRIDLWYRTSAAARWPLLKRALWAALKGFKTVTGVVLLPSVDVAIRKGGAPPPRPGGDDPTRYVQTGSVAAREAR